MNETVLLVPPGAVTLTFLGVVSAPAVIAKDAVTVVSFTTVRPLAVTPVPDTLIAVVPVRPLPVRVIGTLVPCSPNPGAIELNTGPSTVKVWVVLVPPDVVTLTFLTLIVAAAVIVKLAVIVKEFTTVMGPTRTSFPDTSTFSTAVKLEPVSFT